MESKIINYLEKAIDSINSNVIILSIDFIQIARFLNKKFIARSHVDNISDYLFSNYSIKSNKNILLQSFDLNFPSSKLYDKRGSISIPSALTKAALKSEKFKRSENPMYSYLYSNSKFDMSSVNAVNIFGNKSVFSGLIEMDAYLLTLGHHYIKSFTNVHHAEALAKVNYRENIIFTGRKIDEQSNSSNCEAVFFGRKPNICLHSGLNKYGEDIITKNKDICKLHIAKELNNLYGYAISMKKTNDLLVNNLLSSEKKMITCVSPQSRNSDYIYPGELDKIYSGYRPI